MENYNRSSWIGSDTTTSAERSRKLLASSFSWMALALVLSTLAAWMFSYIPELNQLLVKTEITGNYVKQGLTIFGWVVMFAPIILVLVMSARLQKMSMIALITCFILFSVVNGMSLFFVFSHYQIGKIINVFLSTTALFGLFAAAGYFTKTDLSKLGSILMIGLFGIVIAGLINFFVGSQTMDYVISFIGVVIFTGLTAYDVQKIKNMGEMVEEGETMSKMAIMGALSLYLDFINLFLFLLRLFGGSRD
ncbi:MAG: Bax inhibitor-1/YccA family protein [Bacteroidota bacterium]|jgi:FtsH-binding integral membrane protein